MCALFAMRLQRQQWLIVCARTTTTTTTSLNKHNVDDDNVSIVVQLLKTMPMKCGICVQGVLRSVTAAAANGDCPIVAFQLLPMTTTPTIEYYVGYVRELIIC